MQLLLGAFAVQQGQLELGRSRYSQALVHYEQSQSQISCAKLHNNIAVIDHMQHNTEAALAGYQKSLEIRQQQGDQKGEAQLYNNIASLEWDAGDKQKALLLHEQALALRERLGDLRGMVNSLIALVEAYSHFMLLEPAKARFKELCQRVFALQNEHLMFYTLHAAGCLALALGLPELAVRCFAHPAHNPISPSECQFNCRPYLALLEQHPTKVGQALESSPEQILRDIAANSAMHY